jgi:hypothetical protein
MAEDIAVYEVSELSVSGQTDSSKTVRVCGGGRGRWIGELLGCPCTPGRWDSTALSGSAASDRHGVIHHGQRARIAFTVHSLRGKNKCLTTFTSR